MIVMTLRIDEADDVGRWKTGDREWRPEIAGRRRCRWNPGRITSARTNL